MSKSMKSILKIFALQLILTLIVLMAFNMDDAKSKTQEQIAVEISFLEVKTLKRAPKKPKSQPPTEPSGIIPPPFITKRV